MNTNFTFKKSLFFLFLLITMQIFSQENQQESRAKNEIKIDVSDIVFFSALEISYERFNSSDMTYGVAFLWNINNDDFYENFAITPFFRYYFFNKEDFGVKGFFVEAFSKFASGEYSESLFFSDDKESYFDVGLGFSIGNKWVSSKGFTAELSIGSGRNLKLSNTSPDFVFRGGFSIGYMF